MTCAQLTTVCIFMTTCQIASGPLSFVQRLALSHNYPNSLMNHGVLRRPPSGYHYETLRHVLNTYPKNSYTIKHGLSNIVRNNNNGGSTPSKGGKPRKKKKRKKSDDDEDPDDTSSPTNSPPSADPAGSPADETPPPESPPPEAQPPPAK